MSLTYEVEFWAIRQRKNRRKPFELRWRVGDRPHSQSFRLKTQAEGRQSQLLEALRQREQFDVGTGLPASELHELKSPTWYEHACTYALMKWPDISAKHRAGIADALTAVTPTLVVASKEKRPPAATLRRALQAYVFQAARDDKGRVVLNDDGRPQARKDVETPPEDMATALAWMAKHSMKVSELKGSEVLRDALFALSHRLDGKVAAENTTRRKYSVFNNALRYAVERDLLAVNPLTRIDWSPPQTDDEIDFRYVPNPKLARSLIQSVGERGVRGEHLEAFFGCMYYAAMRPSEVAALGESACRLPDEGDAGAWGELVLSESRPEVAAGWTDDGLSYEKRGLKKRARKATRSVPIPPDLVSMLRTHLARYGTAPDGRMFRAAGGGRLRSTEYADVWQLARHETLAPADQGTPLAEVPYSLRHACVSLWLKAGVDPVEVASRAGHSVTVLYRFYAKVIKGRQDADNARITRALASGDADVNDGA
ncbi:tyrosine-type recombinase/integrase [Streptomyces sp. CBMA29]|uniref:tyrosine-type recombinase/integrase n=1 Tax=Streptomyces sp. CBMA29 TaxID=1896314 RepID=UPI001661C4AC|nr:site-specific integrase [Streptomyces sp. CBMA29]MBD0736191.1 integrase [Streptomyces sp. CBMA29]